MTQKNTNKRTFKKSYFIWSALIFFTLGGAFSAFAAPAPVGSESRNEATEKLLSAVKSASTSVEEVVRLIQDGADVNAVDHRGWTHLSYAVQRNLNPEILRTLIDKGADVNAADSYGWTPLMRVGYGNLNAMRILIENGADVNVVDYQGSSPLIRAAAFNREPLKISKSLRRPLIVGIYR